MPFIERKKKMISLRVSDAEYAALKSQYRTHGARNVSDLARLALNQFINGSAPTENQLALKVAELEDRIHALESEMLLILEQRNTLATSA